MESEQLSEVWSYIWWLRDCLTETQIKLEEQRLEIGALKLDAAMYHPIATGAGVGENWAAELRALEGQAKAPVAAAGEEVNSSPSTLSVGAQ